MTPESTISLALIFGFTAFVGNIIGIVIAILGRKDKKADAERTKLEEENKRREEENKRNIDNEKNFLKVNLKLDSFSNDLKTITRNSDKTATIMNQIQQHIIVIDSQLKAHDKTLEDHAQRIQRLEESNEEKH